MFDQRRRIMDLEREIERLSLSAERCRKIMVVSKVAAAGGAAILLCLALGILRFQAGAFLASLTAVLAGLSLLGTHSSTLDEMVAALKECEAERSRIIDGLGLQVAETN
ncbi:MAG TPA: hypothetical protein VHL98_00410 [Microvirga sp.]|jgi:hypothetical protein|nr:hypothetical protein [Microvirga sp.]